MSALRVSDAERDRAAEGLGRAWCAGYLSFETFSARLDAAYAARSRAELRRLLDDVPLGLLGAVRAGLVRASALVRGFPSAAEEPPPTLRLPPPGAAAAITIGRASGSDVRLADDTVSRRHAVLVHDGETWVVLDAGSTNGVYVNGRRVWRGAIHAGDVLELGHERLRISEQTRS